MYILQAFTLPQLRNICKTYKIKGYSGMTKKNIVLLIRNNLSEEEQREFLREKENQIIEKYIYKAFDILHKKGNERLVSFRIVNREEGYIEAQFEGKANPNTMWTTECYLSINNENINDPERDCDCGIGSSNGFCPHFWVMLFIALKLGFFDVTDWKLTYLPFGIQSKLNIIDSLTEERM
ncbi:MAG: Rho termination factor N-terminal domain-containing protein [Promethearchaeota archaeon]